MPNLSTLPIPLFQPTDAYHFDYDNIPLNVVVRRENLINLAVDNLVAQTANAAGTQGSFNNRLNQSINADGSLISTAIDAALHLLSQHTDDPFGTEEQYDAWLASRTGPFVRMEKAESDKLANIANDATDIVIQVINDDNTVIAFDSGIVKFIPSSTVNWRITAPNQISADLGFPIASAHQHFYDQDPLHDPDTDTLYYINSEHTAYIEGSLRVYINGLRLSSSAAIYVPGALVNDPWTLLTFAPDPETGSFSLSTTIAEEDIIRIDYDISFAE